jgi:predicted house-cleaning noncanonical NTP pyrophosphatase (MazG superfamily)
MRYNKLVRDRIPEIIKKSGKQPIYRTLNDAEMKGALKAKLVEETQELVNAETKEQMLEEIADVTEVLLGIMRVHKITLSEIRNMGASKAVVKGVFSKGYFLEEVQE